MRLKSLTIQGFKSFPDKTVINFDDGITAIVGPNGSGKSNITDAIRWVLGEMSTKTLRGNKMEDVIFDGAHGRTAMGFAEVSLTLDNSDGTLPIDFSEVTVSRKYYRSGESEYLINNSPVRLKDINELFMDTGIGRDGYSIIGQGKIAEIISGKSDERRQIFEEAAGISKFRYKKNESERKLEQTQENLLRLLDILAELEERVGPLAEQAEKAKKYIELRDEKKSLEITLWLSEIDEIRDNRSKLENDCAIAHKDLDENEEKNASVEADIDKKYADNQQVAVKIDELRENLNQISEKVQAKNNEISLIKNDIEHNRELISRLSNDIKENRFKADEIDLTIAEKEAEINTIGAEVEALNGELNELLTKSESIFEKSQGTEDKLQMLNADIIEKSARLTDAKIQEGYLDNSIQLLSEELERFNEQLTDAQSDISAVLSEKEEFSDKLEEITDQKESCENIISGYRLRMESAKSKIDKQTLIRDELQRNVEQKKLRINTLNDMQKHFSGFYDSVKTVMNASEHGILKGVHGPVSSVIRTEEKYSVAIETALGNQIQNIIVNTDNDAKAAINYLKNNKAGRATFLPVSTIKGSAVSKSEFKGSGIIGIASGMVTCSADYRQIVDSMLGRICIVDNIDNAVNVAKASGHKYRIVTLDGQVVNAGGSLTGGSASRGSGILNRRNEIEKLEKELRSSASEFEKIDTALKELNEKYNADVAYIDGVNAQIKDLDDQQVAASLRMDDILNRLGNANESKNKLISLIEENKKSAQDKKREKELTVSDIENLENDIKSLTEQADALSSDREEAIREREQTAQRLNDIKMDIMAKEKDEESVRLAISQMLMFKKERDVVVKQYQDEIASLENSIAEYENGISAAQKDIELFNAESDEVNKEIEALIVSREDFEKVINGLRTESKNLQLQRENLIREAERLDAKREAVEGKYNSIVMRLFDEYELTLSDAQPMRIRIENMQKASQRVNELKGKIKRLGDVNIGAIEEYKSVKERYDFLSGQVTDLQNAKTEIEKVIVDLTQRMRTIFAERFKVINARFKETFIELFDGGNAELILSDPSDVLESGIEIKVSPPGKVIKNMSSLSGGEQAFVAIALYFAILKVRPTPFCVMDEIEAALDEVNTIKFADYMSRITGKTQFVVVTHRRGTMEGADVLYGVTMQENGVSKMLTINVNDVAAKLNIN